MSTIAPYLKMNRSQLEEEIIKQKKKIASAQESITLLKRLQMATDMIARERQDREQHNMASTITTVKDM